MLDPDEQETDSTDSNSNQNTEEEFEPVDEDELNDMLEVVIENPDGVIIQ